MNAPFAAHLSVAPDPFDDAMKKLLEWDRECRELHLKHMEELKALNDGLASFEVRS